MILGAKESYLPSELEKLWFEVNIHDSITQYNSVRIKTWHVNACDIMVIIIISA